MIAISKSTQRIVKENLSYNIKSTKQTNQKLHCIVTKVKIIGIKLWKKL